MVREQNLLMSLYEPGLMDWGLAGICCLNHLFSDIPFPVISTERFFELSQIDAVALR